jgi:hypothetical protein
VSWRTSPPTSFSQLDRWLGESEQTIALVERCRPENLLGERRRLEGSWQRGERAVPVFHYAPAPRFGSLRRALDGVADTLECSGPIERLYAARARELSLEAWVAEAVGQLGRRAEARFRSPADGHARQAEAWASEWTRDPPGPSPCPRAPSDDPRDPWSLSSALRREVTRRGLPWRVVVRDDLLAAAATGEGVIAVRGGATYEPAEVSRIVTHEVEGHALPRWRAAQQGLGLLRVGTAGSCDDEEGRALWLERRHAGALRRAELGWRHLGALAVRKGADFVELVELLLGLGAPLPAALDVAIRCGRGGGLAREVVYLPALSRIEQAHASEPEIVGWLEQGRVSLAAARVLARHLGHRRASPGSAPGADTRWASCP